MNADVPALSEELEDIALQLAEQCLALVPQTDSPEASWQPMRDEYARLAMTCELYGQDELARTARWGGDNLGRIARLPADAQRERLDQGLPYQWIEYCAAYLADPGEAGLLVELRNSLLDPGWPEALSMEQLEALLTSLCTPADEPAPSGTTAPEESPQESDTSAYPLRWSDDVHPELLDAFFIEAPVQAAQLAGHLRAIAASEGVADEESCRTATRLAHTLKGASSVVGIDALTELTHRLEDILNHSVASPLPAPLREDMGAAADCLEGLLDALQGSAPPPDNFPALRDALETWRKRLEEEADEEPQSAAGAEAEPTAENPRAARAGGLRHASEPKLLVPVSLVDRLLNLVDEMATTTGRALSELERVLDYGLQAREQDQRARRILAEYASLVDEALAAGIDESPSAGDGDEPFDALEMDRYNNAHGVNNMLEETLADSREIHQASTRHLRRLNDILHDQNRVREEIGATLLRTRLVPFRTLVPRLERIVRETCRATGKRAELVVEENQLALDTDIINDLAEPLLHLLRNAVDHGIEPAGVRSALGKPASGRITLSGRRIGNQIELTLHDDGAGLDPERIRRRAIERGLIDADSELDEAATLALVMRPGFSTRDEVSTVSGRGIGMDIAQATLQRMRGSLRIESRLGEGTRIHLRVPATLVSVNAVIARAGGHVFAVPGDSIAQLLYIDDDALELGEWPEALAAYHPGEACWRYRHDGETLAIEPLEALLGLPTREIEQAAGATALLIETTASERHLLHVDEIAQTRNILLKPLEPYLGNVPGVIGACLLNDGDVAPVLDIARLLDYRRDGFEPSRRPPPAPTGHRAAPDEILIVDDSLSNRKALSLMIEQLGYTPLTAIDGIDALERLEEHRPALVLTDLEMPRMNGIDLTQTLRQQPEISEIPVVMITSRSSRKHREQAREAGVDDYLTKPVDDETLSACVRRWTSNEVPA